MAFTTEYLQSHRAGIAEMPRVTKWQSPKAAAREERNRQIIARYAGGEESRAIAKSMGVTSATVLTVCHQADVTIRPNRTPVGPNTLIARELYAQGAKPRDIALTLGISRARVYGILQTPRR